MDAEERRALVAARMVEEPPPTQQQLAAECGANQKTISRDIAELRRRGVLPRPSAVKVTAGPSAGEELVEAIRAEMAAKGLEPDSREEGLLRQVRQTADDIAELRALVAVEGMTFKPAQKGGPPRMHPAVAEIRQARTVLSRLLDRVQLEEPVAKNSTKQRAANTRWRAHQLQQLRHAEGKV